MSSPYNPYAAPHAAPPPFAPPTAGAAQPWTVGEVFSVAWQRFTENWVVLALTFFLYVVITQTVGSIGLVSKVMGSEAGATGLGALGSAAQLVVGAYLQVGLTRIGIAVARGQSPSFGMLFAGADRIPAQLGLTLLVSFALLAGFLLLVVPGIILGLGLCISQYYVVDSKMGPVASMKASWAATRGHKVSLFGFGLAATGVVILGFLALLVGVFAAAAIVNVALAVIYVRLSGTAVSGEMATGTAVNA